MASIAIASDTNDANYKKLSKIRPEGIVFTDEFGLRGAIDFHGLSGAARIDWALLG
jgi:hypothetical protein